MISPTSVQLVCFQTNGSGPSVHYGVYVVTRFTGVVTVLVGAPRSSLARVEPLLTFGGRTTALDTRVFDTPLSRWDHPSLGFTTYMVSDTPCYVVRVTLF